MADTNTDSGNIFMDILNSPTSIRSLMGQLQTSAEEYKTQRAKDIAESRTALSQYGTSLSDALSGYEKGISTGIGAQSLALKNLQKSFGKDYSSQMKLLQDYLNENYYQNYLQSPQAQAALRQLQTQYQDVIQSTRGSAVKSGATPGAEIAARTSAAKAYGEGVLGLSAQGEAKKENVYQNYLSNLNTLTQQKQAGQQYVTGQKSNLLNLQTNVAGNVLQGKTNIAGTQYTGLRDILGSSAQNDLAFQNMISNILNAKFTQKQLSQSQQQIDQQQDYYNLQQQANLINSLTSLGSSIGSALILA